MTRITRALKRHDERCKRYAQRERVWLATSERDALTAPARIRFAYQRTDVLMSYLTTEKPVGRVAPLRPGKTCEDAAKALQKATNEWRRRDRRDEKEIRLALAACIFGTAPAKSVWEYVRVTETVRRPTKPLIGPVKFVEKEQTVTLRDEPGLIPYNPYDVAWDPSASGPEDMRYVVAFSYPTKREMQAAGYYSNVDDLAPNNARQAAEYQRPGRDRDLEGRIEVCEVWDKEENRLAVVANRSVLVRDEDSPYKHHALPWVFCTTQDNLWTLDGTSEVEVVAAIQAEMHSFRDQWITNAKLANKLLLIVDSSTNDLDKVNNSLMVDDGKPVNLLTLDAYGNDPKTWSPAASLVPLGMEINAALKVDMDDMSGVNQYISGQTDTQVDPKTATEVQTLASASQRRINAKKNMLAHGYKDASVLDLRNMKQFFNTPLAIRMEGKIPEADSPGEDWSFDFVEPQDVVDADFEYLMTDADENIDKQEKRTQWLQLYTAAATSIAAYLPGEAKPSLPKLWESVLESYDVENPDEFMIEPPPPLPPNVLLDAGNGVPPGLGGLAQGGAPPLGPAPPPLGGPGQAAPTQRGYA